MWAWVTILSAAMAFAAGQGRGQQQPQQGALPAGPGKQILDRACTTCHGADAITKYHFTTKNEYADIVSSMIGTGAIVSQQEFPILVDYLFDNLGAKPAAPAASDDAGQAILEQACTSCHGLDGMKNHVYDKKEDYQSLVSSMIANGAVVSNEQLPILVDYLFKTYGKK